MAEADPGSLQPDEPLRIVAADAHAPDLTVEGDHWCAILQFNREPTEREMRMYRELPSTPIMFADAKSYAERMMLAELVVRLFRFYVLGTLVLPDSPLAMDWLKSFIDGEGGHGPLGGGPLRWPNLVPSACNILARWGFEPTPTIPPYVVRRKPS